MKTPLQELQDWVNTELRLDGYEHKVISDKIETMLEKEKKVIKYSYWEYIPQGAIFEYWENEVDSLKNDTDALNEFYRQFPRTESHAFRDEVALRLYSVSQHRELLLDFLKKQEYCGLVEILEDNFEHYVDEYLKDK